MLFLRRLPSPSGAPSARSPARLCRAGLTSLALALALAACAAPAAPPPGLRDAPRSALHAAPATPAARPPLAAPEARPPVARGETSAPRPELSLVLTSTVTQVGVAPFPGGAVLLDRSLLAIARGRVVRQDPAWLAGLPEYITWWSLRWPDPDGREHDPPAVGDWPPGPATSACTSPVVHLGRSLTPALQSALRKHTDRPSRPAPEGRVREAAHSTAAERKWDMRPPPVRTPAMPTSHRWSAYLVPSPGACR